MKIKRIWLSIVSLIIVMLVIICIYIWKKNTHQPQEVSQEMYKEIFFNTYYCDMGSLRLKIFENGDVKFDVEIEEPNHSADFVYYRTLNEEEMVKVNENIDNKNEVYKIVFDKEFTGQVFDLPKKNEYK